MQNFKASIEVLNQGRATLDPVAIIAIKGAIDHAHFRAVDVTTQDAVMPPALGHAPGA